jgi:hypothetical protein
MAITETALPSTVNPTIQPIVRVAILRPLGIACVVFGLYPAREVQVTTFVCGRWMTANYY